MSSKLLLYGTCCMSVKSALQGYRVGMGGVDSIKKAISVCVLDVFESTQEL